MYHTPIKGKIQIMGQDVEIIIDDYKCAQHEADGLTEGTTIYLKSEYEDIKHYLMTYRHECFHALCEILGIQLDIHTEEILAHTVSRSFTYDL